MIRKRKGHSKSTKRKMSKSSCRQPYLDFTNARIGKLTVAWPAGYNLIAGKPRAFWLCFCDCGNSKLFSRAELRRTGKRSLKSCGCVRRSDRTALNNLYAQYRNKAKERKLEWSLSVADFERLITSPCHYTGRSPQQKFTPKGKNPSPSILWNGIDRTDNSKGYVLENCVPCWGVVNKMKLTLSKQEFLAVCNEIAKLHPNEEIQQCQVLKTQGEIPSPVGPSDTPLNLPK